MKELEDDQLKESKSIDAKIESLLKKYGFKFWKGDPKGGSPNEDTIYDKTTEDGEWTIEYDLPIVRREDSQGIYWDSARTASYHIYFYPREDKIDKFISLFNKKYKSKFKKKDLSLEQGFDLGYGLFNNEKEFLMKLEHELKKTENRVKDIFENITTSSITGMGEVTLPTATQTGSGDVPANSGDAEEEYKKKKKKMKKLITFESFVNEAKSIKVTKKEWPYVEFKIGSKKHKVEFDYEDIIDNHGNEGQDQYWLGKDDDGKEWSIDVYADYNGDVQDVHYDTIVAESLVNEAFSRMSKDTIENELYKASQELSKYYDWLKAGNDSGKGETLNSIIDLLKKSKSNIKRFNKPEEVKGTIYESVVNEAFKFSKKEVEAAANLIASAISQADKVKAKVHDLEYDKGRGAGFEISIDGEKYDGGSYTVKDNGDVVNSAIGNKHPNAVYNTIGNKDIADVFINMEKYESIVTEAKFVKEFNKEVLDAKTKEEVTKIYPNAKFYVGKSDHFFGDLEDNLFFKAYYTKAQKEFKIKSVYSEKGSNYVHLYNESIVNEAATKSAGLVQFAADEKAEGKNAEIHLATFDGSGMEAQSTNKTWDDGVPVTKNFTRGGYKRVAPKGEVYIIESDNWWYFTYKAVWYAVKRKDYGTPPFEY